MLALAVAFFMPGVPFLFAGDEIGIMGGYDPDCRRTFEWDRTHWNEALYQHVLRLSALNKTPPLREGKCSVDCDNGVVRIRRYTETQSASLFINPTDAERTAFDISVPAMGYIFSD